MTLRRPIPRFAAALLAVAALNSITISASAASASNKDAPTEAVASNRAPSTQIAELWALQAADQRVADIAWRLLTKAGDLCPDQGSATGISLHSADQYTSAARDSAEAAFGFFNGHPSVLSVAKGSPAATAGIQTNDTLMSINGDGLVGTPSANKSPSKAARYEQIDQSMRALENLPAGRTAEISIIRRGVPMTLRLSPVIACKSRVELVPGPTVNGSANGYVAQISGGLLEWTQNDDELALVIAHEVAHNILRHQAEIDQSGITTGLFGGFGKSGRRLRDMEREADRLGTWLAARAGFDYHIAPMLWERLSKRGGIGALLATTHPSPSNRRQSLEAVVADISKAELTK